MKLLLFAVIVALVLYLGLRDESKEPSRQSTSKIQRPQTVQEEPEKIDKEKKSWTQEKREKEEPARSAKDEEVLNDTEEADAEDEPDEEIAEDERAEDYYKKSNTLPQGNLIGGAEVEWIEPDKSEKPVGKFGLPPPAY